MSSDVIPSSKPYFTRSDIEEMKEHLDKILSSGKLTLGEYAISFEEQFAKFVGVRHATAVSSGTGAIEIALRAHNVERGDELILPTNTFAATGAAVVSAGGKPIITDVSKSTLTLDAENIRAVLTNKSRGVIAVHVGGLICPEIDAIREICEEKGLFLIEDAAHAHGSTIDGRQAGSLGSTGCFSFYPTKVMTTGEGGMMTTDNEEVARVSKILRDQGKENSHSNRIVRIGYNWRIPELSAALGMVQLRRLPEIIRRRREIAKTYDEIFDAMGMQRIVIPSNVASNYYKYTIILPDRVDRDKLKALCRSQGVIYGAEVYCPPLHMQPAFREFVSNQIRFEVSERLCARIASPPLFSNMTSEQAERVVNVTKEALVELSQ